MTKKEVKETLKKRRDAAAQNREEIKTLGVLEERHSGAASRMPSQDVIRRSVNMYTGDKAYDISLPKEHYRTTYTINGAHSLIYSDGGFCAAHNTQTLQPLFDMRLDDEIKDARWLHNEQYFACAQEAALYIYNDHGAELHAVRSISSPRFLQFLPYHFLLAAYTAKRRLSYFDTSMGKMAAELTLPDQHARPTAMGQNPSNAIVYLGTGGGSVSLWTPAQAESIMTVNCGIGHVGNVAIDRAGARMVVSGDGGRIACFDIRETYKPLSDLNVGMPVCKLSLSQTNMLAVSSDSKLLFFSDFDKYLMKYRAKGRISSLEFCNHEDILAVGHSAGVSYLAVPGSGDPTYDFNEATPFMSNTQRKQMEVRRLLEKIPYDLIAHDHNLGHLARDRKTKEAPGNVSVGEHGAPRRTALSRFRE